MWQDNFGSINQNLNVPTNFAPLSYRGILLTAIVAQNEQRWRYQMFAGDFYVVTKNHEQFDIH